MPAQDLRNMAPPGPIEIILNAADELQAGGEASFILPHFPGPLIPMLDEYAALEYRFETSSEGGVLLHLRRPAED
ncbi:hypothetical protein NH8B_2847 [Pseudogulbenkiania sp. NH8B]|uniref:DUF2249 domain-containing protein n=1 Tax=Pseudogulbenkiania sp. (strain NH8B) TaxID=748280 RepID=UPI0002279CB5|nr:DUF2249 domain-containing protein [Pseudogulbenkiania sp. NH8B]BAK77640.1 hypothetical protein NH8B_2847 [Pseudogulbenkiania sp. NH8B]